MKVHSPIRTKFRKAAGFTLLEAVFASSMLAMVLAVGVGAGLKSYSIATEARYYDAARNVLGSLADVFQCLPYADEEGKYLDFFEKTGDDENDAIDTGDGLDSLRAQRVLPWSDTDTNEVTPTGLEVTIYTANGEQKRARVTRAIWEEQMGSLGPFLVARFGIEFDSGLRAGLDPATNKPYQVRSEVTVARAIVNQ